MGRAIAPLIPLVLLAFFSVVSGFSAINLGSAQASSVSAPPVVRYYVPITITNSLGSSTPAPFQQMIQVDSASYSVYEASNLQNVFFFNSDGSVVPSWLESGNSVSSTATIYWLNLAEGIQAHSSVTVYMGLATPSSDLFNNVRTGEAPQLSPTYGEYDDGIGVFSLYDNFVGTSLNTHLWVDNSATSRNTISINNGLTLTAASAIGYQAAFYSIRTFPTPTVVEYYGQPVQAQQAISTVGGGGFGVVSPELYVSSVTYGTENGASGLWAQGDSCSASATGNPASNGVYSMFMNSTTLTTRFDYGFTFSEPCALDSGNVFFASQLNAGTVTADWVRVRSYPPNGLMPAVTFGTTALNKASPNITTRLSHLTIIVGNSVTDSAVITGGYMAGGTVKYEYFSGGACSGIPTTVGAVVPVTKGIVPPSASQVFKAVGSYSWKAVYSGDVNNNGAVSKCEALTVSPPPPLAPPTISASPTVLGKGQAAMLSTTSPFTGGTPPFTCLWLVESPSASGFSALGSAFTSGCTRASKPSASTRILTTEGTWSFELQVTDSSKPHITVVSPPVSVTVGNLFAVTLTVSCSPASVIVGSATTCFASAKSIGPLPTGAINWSGGTPGKFSTTTCNLFGGACSVKFTPALAGQKVKITASYSGDLRNLPTTGTNILTVIKQTSQTTVSCKPDTAPASQATVTCTATLKGYLPTGKVTWSQTGTGVVSLATKTCALTSSACSITMTTSSSGTVFIKAKYLGDTNNGGSFGSARLTITQASTKTTVSCTQSTFGVGESTTCTATVSGGHLTHIGTIIWSKVSGTGTVKLSSISCTLSSGKCSVTITGLVTGSITIEAAYSGDTSDLKSSGTVVLSII